MNFEKICKKTQEQLKDYLINRLANAYSPKNIIKTTNTGFVYAHGTFPVLLVAHLDTVHKESPKQFCWNGKTKSLSSPQGIGGDDRCGVYMILEIIKKFNCSVLFCEDEEKGGIGADIFANRISEVEECIGEKLDFNYIIEFDRMNGKDAVFYDCDNEEFEKFITKDFYKTSFGSFSDISIVAPALGVAAVNLSCGYYKPHTTDEYVVLSEMKASINAAIQILERTDVEVDKFEYIELKYGSLYGGYDKETSYDDWYHYGSSEEIMTYFIEYFDANYQSIWDCVTAKSEDEAIGKFLKDHPNICYNDIIDVDYEYYESKYANI